MRLIGEDGTGSGGSRVEVGSSGDHRDPWFEPEVIGHGGEYRPDHGAGRAQRGKLPLRDPGRPDEHRVVVELGGTPIVGEPRPGHGGRRCRRHPGEAHGEIVDRLQVPAGGCRHPRQLVSRKSMWPMGSAPDVEGAPPLRRIHRTAAVGE